MFFELFNILISVTGGIILAGLFEKSSYYDRLSERINLTSNMEETYIALLFIMEGLSGLACIANGQLVSFHIFLSYKKMTTYEYILQKRKSDSKYKISPIKIINEREAIEEVPLEEVFEPYTNNPQYDNKDNDLEHKDIKVLPQNYSIPPISDSEKSIELQVNKMEQIN